MAIQRAEGFAHFNTFGDWAAKGHNGGGVNSSILPTSGRDGRGCASIGLNNDIWTIYKTAVQTSYVHYAFRCTARVSGGQIAGFRDSSTQHLMLLGYDDGSMSLYRLGLPFATGFWLFPGTTLLGSTAPNTFRSNIWHHIQIKAKIDPSAGSFQLKVDGVDALNLSGINTSANGNTTAVQFGMGSGLGSATHYISDLVITDETATDANGNATTYTGFLGDVAVYEYVAPIDGDLLQWTRSSGAGTWSDHVNQNPQDGDTTYLSSATTGQINTFSFPNVSASVGSVVATKNTVCHKKDAPAFAELKLVSRSNDAVNHFSPIITVTQSYKFDEIIHDVDPKDGSAWTNPKVNATQFGFDHFA